MGTQGVTWGDDSSAAPAGVAPGEIFDGTAARQTIDLREARSAGDPPAGGAVVDLDEFRQPEQIQLSLFATAADRSTAGQDETSVLDFPESALRLVNATALERAAKRTIDIVGASLALLVLSPVLLVTAVAVLVLSGRPIFYISERVGKDGKPFRFIKFRTMNKNAAGERELLVDLNEADGPVFKIRNDPRITPIGGFVRRYSLDELPQFLHVLSGKMSLVGPRPPLPEEVASYSAWEWERLSVKPGLTCIWQVSGRSDLAFRSWVELDIEYIRTWSIRKDLVLILKTIPAVINARGAY